MFFRDVSFAYIGRRISDVNIEHNNLQFSNLFSTFQLKMYLWSHGAHFVAQAEVVLSLNMRCELVAAIRFALSLMDHFCVWPADRDVNVQKAAFCDFECKSKLEKNLDHS